VPSAAAGHRRGGDAGIFRMPKTARIQTIQRDRTAVVSPSGAHQLDSLNSNGRRSTPRRLARNRIVPATPIELLSHRMALAALAQGYLGSYGAPRSEYPSRKLCRIFRLGQVVRTDQPGEVLGRAVTHNVRVQSSLARANVIDDPLPLHELCCAETP
jgi:hypothetical protein